jgi:hypothetical protein
VRLIKLEPAIVSSLPAIFFFIGVIFLAYSPLTMSKVIMMQNSVFTSFYQELNKSDFSSAFIFTLNYVWENVLWVTLLFLVLISFGFIFYIFYLSRTDIRMIIISQIIFIFLTFILTNFSIIMLIIALSLLLGILWEYKTFEPRKNDFSTGYSVVSSRLGLMSIFLCIGIFLTILLNAKNYEKDISESNKELMMGFMPNMTNVKETQKNEIEQITEGFKYSLTERYNAESEIVKTQCKPMYEGLTQGLDNYKNRAFQQIDQKELEIGEEEVSKYLPFFKTLTQITPILIAITGYAFLTVLNSVMGIFGGVVYSIIKRNEPGISKV